MPSESTLSSPAAGVREVVLDAGTAQLSGLLAEPEDGPPRAAVVAVHGGGMRAGYFHGRAHPSVSLLSLGARLGYSVLAVDRPGYGLSAAGLPHGQRLAEQAAALSTALAAFRASYPVGEGVLLLAHSYGGKLALTTAARDAGDAGLVGVDVSGVSHRYAVDSARLSGEDARGTRALHWGPLRLYPPDTFRLAAGLVTPMPERERAELSLWPELLPEAAARVRVPVRFTFAQYEGWWRHDDGALAELAALFTRTRVTTERLRDAGHNISLGWAARSYHLRALAFLEECLTARDQTHPRR